MLGHVRNGDWGEVVVACVGERGNDGVDYAEAWDGAASWNCDILTSEGKIDCFCVSCVCLDRSRRIKAIWSWCEY